MATNIIIGGGSLRKSGGGAGLSKEKADELYQPKGDYKLQKILSQSEYDQINIKDEDIVYVITDDDSGTINKVIFEAQTDPIDAMSGELLIDGGDSDDNSTDTLNGGISTEMDIALDITAKQDALISGKNIKTINNQSLLGSGNIEITSELPENIATLEDISNAVTPIENKLYIELSTFSGAWDTTKQTGYVRDITDVWDITFDFTVNGEGTVELYAAYSPDTPSFVDDKICDLETGRFYTYYADTKKIFKHGVQGQLEEIATVNTGYTQLYFKGNSGSGTYNIINVSPAVKVFNLYTKQQVDSLLPEFVKIGRPIISTDSSTVSMQPNIYYRITDTPSTLTLTFNTKLTTNMEEYFIEFTTSSDGCSLIIPSSVKWMNGEIPALEANSTYQISIVNNLATCAAFK